MATDFLGIVLRDDLPNPNEAPELFDSVLTRRVFAFIIDCVIMGILLTAATIVAGIAGFFTFFLAWLLLPVVLGVVFVGYYAFTLGSPSRATLGMRAMDVVMTPTRNVRLDGWLAILHVILFWITCTMLTPFILLFGLFTPRRQLLHDMIAGTLVVRRSPMIRHWQAMNASYSA